MNNLTSYCIRLYSGLLRVYPAQFRREFADEMTAVFTLSAHESSQHGDAALIALVLSELRDLPFSVIREYLRERQQRVLATDSGGIIMESRLFGPLFQLFSASLFIAFIAFALLVVLPFFALGLHVQPALVVAFGALGPEAFPLYSANFMNPNPLPMLAIWVMLGAPIWGAIFGGSLLLMLGKFWGRLSYRYRLTGILAVLAGATPILFLFLPIGRILFGWWMD